MKIPTTLSVLRLCPVLLALNLQPGVLLAQDTAFTFQGRLNTNGVPYSGSAEFQFTLWDSATNGVALATNTPASVIADVADGLFTVTLDFGISPFDGQPRFLETEVRTTIGPFTTLTPRQPVTPTPYALRAFNLTTNGLAAGTYGNAVTFENVANRFAGGFTGTFTGVAIGDGSGLTNVNAATVGGLAASSFWSTDGNAGANPTNGAFLGTTDNLPLELRVNGVTALRLEPNPAGPNLIGGNGLVAAGVSGATIAGGTGNTIQFGGGFVGTSGSVIGGGGANLIGGTPGSGSLSLGGENVIAGGHFNNIRIDSDFATIGGGQNNIINTNASNATVAGGNGNIATGSFAAIPGGDANAATNHAFAAGHRAKANHEGAFVWADSTDADFASTGADQFLIRASGGVGINTANPVGDLDVNGPIVIQGPALAPTSTSSTNLLNLMVGGGSSPVATNGSRNGISFYEGAAAKAMSLGYDGSGGASANALRIYNSSDVALFTFQANGRMGVGTNTPQQALHVVGNILATGTVTGSSDRNAKEHFAPVNPAEVLDKVAALPISRWSYKADAGVTHLGPMAQDFYAAFDVGMDDKHISMVDADGVALAAIQGLNDKVERGRQRADSRMQQLEAENAELKARLAALEKVILTRKPN